MSNYITLFDTHETRCVNNEELMYELYRLLYEVYRKLEEMEE